MAGRDAVDYKLAKQKPFQHNTEHTAAQIEAEIKQHVRRIISAEISKKVRICVLGSYFSSVPRLKRLRDYMKASNKKLSDFLQGLSGFVVKREGLDTWMMIDDGDKQLGSSKVEPLRTIKDVIRKVYSILKESENKMEYVEVVEEKLSNTRENATFVRNIDIPAILADQPWAAVKMSSTYRKQYIALSETNPGKFDPKPVGGPQRCNDLPHKISQKPSNADKENTRKRLKENRLSKDLDRPVTHFKLRGYRNTEEHGNFAFVTSADESCTIKPKSTALKEQAPLESYFPKRRYFQSKEVDDHHERALNTIREIVKTLTCRYEGKVLLTEVFQYFRADFERLALLQHLQGKDLAEWLHNQPEFCLRTIGKREYIILQSESPSMLRSKFDSSTLLQSLEHVRLRAAKRRESASLEASSSTYKRSKTEDTQTGQHSLSDDEFSFSDPSDASPILSCQAPDSPPDMDIVV